MHTELANRIKLIRNRRNLSQERFGSKVGVSGKTISAYETGKATPPLKVLEKITSVYDVTLAGVNTKDLGKLEEMIKTVQQNLQQVWDIIGVRESRD